MGSRTTNGVTTHRRRTNQDRSISGPRSIWGSRPTNGVTTYQKVTTQFRLFFLFARSRPFFFIERPLKVTNDCWPSSSGGGSDQLTPNVQRPTANERATKKKRRKRPRFSFIHSFDGHHASTRFSQRETTLSLAFDFNRRLSILIRSTRPPAVGGWGWGALDPQKRRAFSMASVPSESKNNNKRMKRETRVRGFV